eukprot:TRINITY_DN1847_c0_g1_i2.p1 TRINITY_DN1847_c0_g1~~TRINITY_DN1847_c0_g1_i2.p1  ORF type:complete len:655 (+),score=122.72 TRINITY_DN1847_c0_g1_i2:289-2253(+)
MASFEEDGMLPNPHYRDYSLDFQVDKELEPARHQLVPKPPSISSINELADDSGNVMRPVARRDEGMGRSIELNSPSNPPLLPVIDSISQRCDYFQPSLAAKEAAQCLETSSLGAFLIHAGPDASLQEDDDEEEPLALSFKDEDGSIIHKVIRVNKEGTYLYISHLRFDTVASLVGFLASPNSTAPCALKLTAADGRRHPHIGRGWYTLELTNRQVEAFLSRSSVCHGAFIIRPCARRRLQFCLSVKVTSTGSRRLSRSAAAFVRHPDLYQELEQYRKIDISPLNTVEEGVVQHFLIHSHSKGMQLRHSALVFTNLVELVAYYERNNNGDLPCRLTDLTGSGSCQEVDGQQLYVPTLPLPFTPKSSVRRNDGDDHEQAQADRVDNNDKVDTRKPHPIDARVQAINSSRSLPSPHSSLAGSHLSIPDYDSHSNHSHRDGLLHVHFIKRTLDSADSLSSPQSSARSSLRSSMRSSTKDSSSRRSSLDSRPPWYQPNGSTTSLRRSARPSRTRASSTRSETDGPTLRPHRTQSSGSRPIDYSPQTLGTTVEIAQQDSHRVRAPVPVARNVLWNQLGQATEHAMACILPTNGSFVVRSSSSCYAYLSLMFQHQVHHFRILRSARNRLYVNGSVLEFDTLDELVRYHRRYVQAPLPCLLD